MVINGALNLVLVFFVFVAVKNRPYVAAALFAVIKAALYFLLSKEAALRMNASLSAQVVLSIVIGCVYAGIASAFIFFVGRLNKGPAPEQDSVAAYSVGGADKISFRWESIPMVLLLVLLLVL